MHCNPAWQLFTLYTLQGSTDFSNRWREGWPARHSRTSKSPTFWITMLCACQIQTLPSLLFWIWWVNNGLAGTDFWVMGFRNLHFLLFILPEWVVLACSHDMLSRLMVTGPHQQPTLQRPAKWSVCLSWEFIIKWSLIWEKSSRLVPVAKIFRAPVMVTSSSLHL